jgi:signal peptidase I
MSDAPTATRGRSKSFLRELLETAVLTVAIFLLVRVALQNFKVDGYSMEPNFHPSEYILVDKFDYWFHGPERGDVIVFRAVPARQPNRDFIKRVIGLPGERVSVHSGAVYINGRRLYEPYISDPPTYTFTQVTVPKNDYFVLGDNRNNSFDSSKWSATPFLDRKYIIGKAWMAYWPFHDVSLFHEPSYRYNVAPVPACPHPIQGVPGCPH